MRCPAHPPRLLLSRARRWARHLVLRRHADLLPCCASAAGSEVVRLYEAVLGKEGFRKGMDLYFQRHDGQVSVFCA